MKRLLIAAIVLMGWSSVMMYVLQRVAPYPRPLHFRQDVDSPILAAELASRAQDLEALLGESTADPKAYNPSAHAISVNTYLDFVYIPVYVVYLWILAGLAGGVRFPRLTRLVWIAALVTGIADYVEDGLMLGSLGGSFMFGPPFPASLAKWALLAMTLIGIGLMLALSRGVVYSVPTDRLLGVAHCIAGLEILGGVFFGWRWGYAVIEAGVTIFAMTVLVVVLQAVLEWIMKLLPERRVVFVDDFCKRRGMGELAGSAVRPVAADE